MDQPLPPASPPLSRDLLVSRIKAALADNASQFITPEDIRSRLIEMVGSTTLLTDPFDSLIRFDLAGGATNSFSLAPLPAGLVRLVLYTTGTPVWFADLLVDPVTQAVVVEFTPSQRVAFGAPGTASSLNVLLDPAGTLTLTNLLGAPTGGVARLELGSATQGPPGTQGLPGPPGSPGGMASVEDYRGVGGDFSDTGTLQSACNAGVPLLLPPLLTILSQINITKAGTALFGTGWGMDSNVATQPGITSPGSKIIWGGPAPAAGTAMLNVRSAVSLNYLWDFAISGVYLLGQNLAPVGLRLSSTRTAHIGRLFVERCTENHALLDDGNGVLHYSTAIDELYMTAGTSPLTLNANGLNIRELPGAGTVGCTWIHGSFVSATMQNGDGVVFGNVDNCQFSKISSGVSGTGKGIRFRGLSDGQHQVSRKNFIRQFSGTNIYAEAKSRNVVDWVNSEGTSVTIEAGASLHYGVIDREDGRRWRSFAFEISAQIDLLLTNGYAVTGTPVIATVGGSKGQVVLFDPATTETWQWTRGPQRANSGGRITTVKGTGIKGTVTNAGNIRLQASVLIRITTQSLGGTFTSQAATFAVDAAGVSSIEEFTITFATPVDYPFGSHVLVQLSRLGADALDTYPDDWGLLSLVVMAEADVANGDPPAYRYDDSPDVGDIT